MTMDQLIAFFGWCSVINIVLLMISALLLALLKESVSKIHSKMFSVDQKVVEQAYFHYLGTYKIAIIMLNIVPYFALKIIS